eukprot:GHVN01106628.1.p1 GENE.GHVN01106628.1~~GHVN01106628.1.p1  ORF type:complete len:796 (-),score=104.35 GHVN01106628.1:200-2587(-)
MEPCDTMVTQEHLLQTYVERPPAAMVDNNIKRDARTGASTGQDEYPERSSAKDEPSSETKAVASAIQDEEFDELREVLDGVSSKFLERLKRIDPRSSPFENPPFTFEWALATANRTAPISASFVETVPHSGAPQGTRPPLRRDSTSPLSSAGEVSSPCSPVESPRHNGSGPSSLRLRKKTAFTLISKNIFVDAPNEAIPNRLSSRQSPSSSPPQTRDDTPEATSTKRRGSAAGRKPRGVRQLIDPYLGELTCNCADSCQLGTCTNSQTLVECTRDRCGLSITKQDAGMCNNRQFTSSNAKRIAKKAIRVAEAGSKGQGVFADKDLRHDTMVCEYVGEVITGSVFTQRLCEYAKEAKEQGGAFHWYVMALNNGAFIDGTRKGGIGRLMNHGCEPNCMAVKWAVGNQYRIGIFTKRDIQAGEELTYDYGFQTGTYDPTEDNCNGDDAHVMERQWSAKFECKCGSVLCRKVVGGTKSKGGRAALNATYLWQRHRNILFHNLLDYLGTLPKGHEAPAHEKEKLNEWGAKIANCYRLSAVKSLSAKDEVDLDKKNLLGSYLSLHNELKNLDVVNETSEDPTTDDKAHNLAATFTACMWLGSAHVSFVEEEHSSGQTVKLAVLRALSAVKNFNTQLSHELWISCSPWFLFVIGESVSELFTAAETRLLLPRTITAAKVAFIRTLTFHLSPFVSPKHILWSLVDKGFGDDEVCALCKKPGALMVCDKCCFSYHKDHGKLVKEPKAFNSRLSLQGQLYCPEQLEACKTCQKTSHRINWLNSPHSDRCHLSLKFRRQRYTKWLQ